MGNKSGARPVHHFSQPFQSRSLPSRSRSRVSSAPRGEISATRRSLRITIDAGDAGSMSPVMGLVFQFEAVFEVVLGSSR